MNCKLLFLFICISFSATFSFCQKFEVEDFGFSFGLNLKLGTHQLGGALFVQAYANGTYFQVNAGQTIGVNFKNYGVKKRHTEAISNFGLFALGGKRETTPNFIVNGLAHNSNYNLALGYNYLIYWNNANAKQRSGGFGIYIKEFGVQTENDLFAGQGRDRFRTGTIQFSYRINDFNFKINSIIWTGETRGAKAYSENKVLYKDCSLLNYGKTSSGIVALGLDYRLNFGNTTGLTNQTFNVLLGLDSEIIRNFMQNTLVHGKINATQTSKETQAFYPMLSSKGLPIRTKEEIKPTKFYFVTGVNQSLFY